MASDETFYCIQGFRSLLDFRINLNPGLNIIVGPNGAGKTNFIEFLDFINALIRQGAANAVSMSGGVSKVFSVENFKKKTPSLFCEITATATIDNSEYEDYLGTHFKFKYQLEVKFNKSESQIYISREKILLYKCYANGENSIGEQKVGSIQITRNGISDLSEPKIDISKRIFAKSERNPLFYVRRPYKNKDLREIFDRADLQSLDPDQSIFSTRPLFMALESMRRVISRGKSYNILPEKARIADHISRPPIIDSDGSGLSSALHYLKKISDGHHVKSLYRYNGIDPESFDMVMHWTTLIFPELQDITVTQDLHLGRYVVNIVINKERSLKISIQSASDGTIKWLALICLIVTNRGMGCLEEPENFLHPKMQSFLLEIIRDSLSSNDTRGYFLISTHSETIINACRPEELVVFRFTSEGTKCDRLKNPMKVKEEINKTGFGLGYYYAANAL